MTSHTYRAALATAALLAPLSLGHAAYAGTDHRAGHARAVHVQPRDVTQRYITALVNKKTVKKGAKVTIAGGVQTDAGTDTTCTAGVALTVERSTKGAIYKTIDHVTTDATGHYSVKETVTKKSRFRISAPETATCSELQSPPRTVTVKTGR